MTQSVTALPNSKEHLQERHQAGRIIWKWLVAIVFARLVFAILAQSMVANLYMLKGHPTPWQAAAPWWIVYGTLIDIGCFVLLAQLTRKEGIRLFDLTSFYRDRLAKDLILGLAFVPLFVILMTVGGIVSGLLIYGASPASATMVILPLWGTLYSLIVWPVIWAFAEEMTYQGYVLPRLEVVIKNKWLPVIIVSFGWALQYSALPLMWDWRWALYRFASSLLIGIVLPILYLRTRRLMPFILPHWVANFISVLMTVILPMMASQN